jgi:tetratricopeptide (TPR) repeat protein
MVYCRTLSACIDTFDYGRAIEWSREIERRAPGLGTVGFPGDCRTHRAAVLVVRGEWTRGAAEAETAAVESRAYDLGHTAQALTALGDIRLRQGDLAAAREAFDRAAELGLPPGPGFALVQLAEGDPEAALVSVLRAAELAGREPLTRARYLPAIIEIARAARAADHARTACADLAAIAASFPSPVLAAAAVEGRGGVAHMSGDLGAAIAHLREATARWRSVGAPYEAARCRMHGAHVAAALGDQGEAAREARSALASWSELGARRDAEAATAFLGRFVAT